MTRALPLGRRPGTLAPAPQRTKEAGERGAGTVMVLGLCAVCMTLALALAGLGFAQQARVASQAAADLGALAGATALRLGFDPCVIASRAVEQNGADVASCEPRPGGIVEVTAVRDARLIPGWAGGRAWASARAGPRWPPTPDVSPEEPGG